MSDIATYNNAQSTIDKQVCEILQTHIRASLPQAESKVWHGHPVWFLAGNPIVGYAVRKHNIQLLFWSGQSFDEPGLEPEGSFKAAQVRYTSPDEIDADNLARWLQKSQAIQWDYKNIVKRRGVLERLQ